MQHCKEGRATAPNADIHLSLGLYALFASAPPSYEHQQADAHNHNPSNLPMVLPS